MNYKLRNVIESYFIAIETLAKQCQPMSTERTSIYHIFTKFFQKTSFILKLDGDEEISGFLLGLLSQKNPQEAYIHLLCLKDEIRGRGFGKKIIDKYIEVVKSKGCKKITLITKPVNKKAITFYTKLGFNLIYKKNMETIKIDGITAVKDYNGTGEHMVIFQNTLKD